MFLCRVVHVQVARFFYFVRVTTDFVHFLRLCLAGSRRAVNLNVFQVFFRCVVRCLGDLFVPSRARICRYLLYLVDRIFQVRFSHLNGVVRYALVLTYFRNDLFSVVVRRVVRLSISYFGVDVMVRRHVAHLVNVRVRLYAFRGVEDGHKDGQLQAANSAAVRWCGGFFQVHFRRFLNFDNAGRNDEEDGVTNIRFLVDDRDAYVILLNGRGVPFRLDMGEGQVGDSYLTRVLRDHIVHPIFVHLLELQWLMDVRRLNGIMVRVVLFLYCLRYLVGINGHLIGPELIFLSLDCVVVNATGVPIHTIQRLTSGVVR